MAARDGSDRPPDGGHGLCRRWRPRGRRGYGQTFDPVALRWGGSSARCNIAGNGATWTGRFVLGVYGAWDGRLNECRELPPPPRRAPPFDETNGREFAVGVWTGARYVTWSGGTGGDIVWVPKDGAVFTPEFDLGPCCG